MSKLHTARLLALSLAQPVAVVVVAMEASEEVDVVVVAETALGETTEVAVEAALVVATALLRPRSTRDRVGYTQPSSTSMHHNMWSGPSLPLLRMRVTQPEEPPQLVLRGLIHLQRWFKSVQEEQSRHLSLFEKQEEVEHPLQALEEGRRKRL